MDAPRRTACVSLLSTAFADSALGIFVQELANTPQEQAGSVPEFWAYTVALAADQKLLVDGGCRKFDCGGEILEMCCLGSKMYGENCAKGWCGGTELTLQQEM